MKYLRTYNESLRDKMTPKSKKEIETVLKNADLTNDFVMKAIQHDYLDGIKRWFDEKYEESKKDNPYILLKFLEEAIYYGNLDIIKYMIDTHNPELDYKTGIELRLAATTDNVDVVKYLVEDQKFPIDLLNNEPLNLAIANANLEVAKYLIDNQPTPLKELPWDFKMMNPKYYKKILPYLDSKGIKYEDHLKHLDHLRESLRDKMTPKSDEEVKNAYFDLFSKLKTFTIDEYPIDVRDGLIKVAKVIDSSVGDLVMVLEDDDNFGVLSDLFDNISNDNIVEVELKDTEDILGGTWFCHPDSKIAYWTSNNYDEPSAWIYNKKYLEETLGIIKKHLNTNESLRDKMTPKSKEEILDSLNANPDITYERTKRSGVGTHLVGEYTIPYDELVELFGEPGIGDWIGNNFYWNLTASNGRMVRIYDNNSGLEGYELMDMDYKWHIGGSEQQDANDLIGYIVRNTKHVTESLRDKMTGVSSEEMKKKFEGKSYLYILENLQKYDIDINDIYTPDEINDMDTNVISYIDGVIGFIAVVPEKIRELLNVGDGIDEIDVSSSEPYKNEFQNEVFITYYENAWGGIDLDEWNNLKNRVEKLVGRNGLEDFDIDTSRMSLTLTFNHELPLEEH